MSGGQDPGTWEWEIITACEPVCLEDLVASYIAAIDANNMVLVYKLRSLMRDYVKTSSDQRCPLK